MSAICDSRMTLPIMPKAPGSVNAAQPPKCGHPRDSVNVASRPSTVILRCRHPRDSVNVASRPKYRHPRESGDPFCALSTTNGFPLMRVIATAASRRAALLRFVLLRSTRASRS